MAKKVSKAAKTAKNNVKNSQKATSKPVKAVSTKLAVKKDASNQKSKAAKVKKDVVIKEKSAKAKISNEKEIRGNAAPNSKGQKTQVQTSEESKPQKGNISVKQKSSEDLKGKKAAKKISKEDAEFEDLADDLEYEETVLADNFRTKTKEEIEEIRSLLGEASVEDLDDVEIALRDAEGRLYCKVRECDELALVDGYCRLHYLKYWKRIQLRKKILTDGKLEKYIDELTQRYPDKYIDMLRADLKSEKTFLSAINELEIEEANEESDMDDDQQGLIDEVRGMQTSGSSGDDDDGF